MKRNLSVGVGMLLALAATAGVVYADASDMIKADIPYQFTIHGKEMPAGEYEMLPVEEADPSAWVIRSVDGKAEDTIVTEDISMKNPAPHTELVFDEIGGHHFLRQLWFEGELNGREIPLTKAQRELEQQGATKTQQRVPGTRAPRSSSTRKH